jgi:hypothetical protein
MFWKNNLPSRKDIVIHGDLDEEHAAKNFLGKDLEQAEAMFKDKFFYYAEDLMWMGPKAFCFYVDAAINYLLSKDANEDSDAVNSFLSAVSFQQEHHAEEIQPAYPRLKAAIETVLSDFDRYDCTPSIYGDLAGQYRELLNKLKSP